MTVDRKMSAIGFATNRLSLRPLAHWWWIPAVFALGFAVLALAASVAQAPVYRSTATLYVTSGSEDSAQSAYQGSLASQQRVLSYAKLAYSDAVVQQAIRESGIRVEASDLKNEIHADSSKDTVLLVVSVGNPDPNDAAILGNAVASSLVDYVAELERPTSGSEPQARLTVVSPAVVESSPVSPNTRRNVVLGGIVGAIVGLGFLYWRVRMDRVIRTPSKLEQEGVVVLGRVPKFGPEESGVVEFYSGSSPAAEAYRKLRTNILLADVDNEIRQIAVSSSGPADGKSETALNLAASLAEAGKRVVIVDGDLRRPVLAERLGLNGDVGVTNCLASNGSVSEYVQDTAVDNLFLLASGPVPPNPSELIGSDKAGKLFEELGSMFDYVIVDTPPVLPVTDAVIAARESDGVLLVVRMGSSTTSELNSALSEFEQGGAVVLGVVANAVESVDSRYQGAAYTYGSRRVEA